MTTSDKPPTSFRLSEQAHANLEAITAACGCNKTAAVEVGVMLLRTLMQTSPQAKIFMSGLIKYWSSHRNDQK